jgi:hypothetical protein
VQERKAGCGDDGVGGHRQWYGRVCGRSFLTRDTRVMVAPMAAGTRREEGISAGQHQPRITLPQQLPSPLSSRAADSRFASRERNDKACALCNIEGPNRRVPQVSLLRPGIPQTNSHWKHPPCSLSLGAKPRDLQFLSRFTATLYYAPAARLQSDWRRPTC